MKKIFVFISVLFVSVLVVQCGPAAEDRNAMHEKAKRVSDSIGKVIDTELADVQIQPKEATQVADTSKK